MHKHLADFEHHGEVPKVILLLFALDHYVVNVGIHGAPHQMLKHLVDLPLVSGPGIL